MFYLGGKRVSYAFPAAEHTGRHPHQGTCQHASQPVLLRPSSAVFKSVNAFLLSSSLPPFPQFGDMSQEDHVKALDLERRVFVFPATGEQLRPIRLFVEHLIVQKMFKTAAAAAVLAPAFASLFAGRQGGIAKSHPVGTGLLKGMSLAPALDDDLLHPVRICGLLPLRVHELGCRVRTLRGKKGRGGVLSPHKVY